MTPGPTIPRVNRQEVINEVGNTSFVLDKIFVNTFQANDTTPSVKNLVKHKCSGVSVVEITDFDDGQEGQTIEVQGDGLTSVVFGLGIYTNTGSDKLLTNRHVYRFTLLEGTWCESSSNSSGSLSDANEITGVLALIHGGLGLNKVVTGDILYAPTDYSLERLAIGVVGKVLVSDGSLPAWSFVTLITGVGALSVGSIIAGFGGAVFGGDVSIPANVLIVGTPGNTTAEISSGTATDYQQLKSGAGFVSYREDIQHFRGRTFSNTASDGSRISAERSRGTIASPSAVLSDDELSRFQARAQYGTNSTTENRIVGSLRFFATENHSSSAAGTKASIYTVLIGATVSSLVIEFQAGVGVKLMEAINANILWNTNGGGNIGASGATSPDKVFVKTGFYGALLDSNAAVDLVLKRNAVTQLTLAATKTDFSLPIGLKAYTVATLPAGAIGMRAYATDLLLPAFLAVAVGGGAVKAPVFYDGTNWVT